MLQDGQNVDAAPQTPRPSCQFLPRDAMRKRGLRCGLVSVCPFVHLSR